VHFEVVLRAQKEVLHTLEKRFYPKFVQSPLYNEFRREVATRMYGVARGRRCEGTNH